MEDPTVLLKEIPHPIQYFPEELKKEYGTPRTDDAQNYSVYSPSLCSSISSMSSASSFQPPFLTRVNSNLSSGISGAYTTTSSTNQNLMNLSIYNNIINNNNNNNNNRLLKSTKQEMCRMK